LNRIESQQVRLVLQDKNTALRIATALFSGRRISLSGPVPERLMV
jgi:hypothetical protein